MAFIYESYSSIEKLLKTISGRENNEAMKGEDHSVRKGKKDFTGTESFEEATKLMLNGWDEKLAEVRQKFDTIARENATTEVGRIRPSTGVVGYAPCVPNAIRGLPNSMITSERVPQKVKCISLIYNSGVDAGWSQNEIIDCGIAVLKLVNNLELKGYRVKLEQEAYSCNGGKDDAFMHVQLKDFRQPIDIKKLCFPLIHPSMLRRICFKWIETVPGLTDRGFRGGYGSPLGWNYERNRQYLLDNKKMGENDYFVTAYICNECRYDIDKIMKRIGMNIK